MGNVITLHISSPYTYPLFLIFDTITVTHLLDVGIFVSFRDYLKSLLHISYKKHDFMSQLIQATLILINQNMTPIIIFDYHLFITLGLYVGSCKPGFDSKNV